MLTLYGTQLSIFEDVRILEKGLLEDKCPI